MNRITNSVFSVLVLLLFPTAINSAEAPLPVPIISTPNVIKDYKIMLEGKKLSDLNEYSHEKARRDVIELILIQQAVALGSFGSPITLHSEQSYKRSMRSVAHATSIAVSSTIWRRDVKHRNNDFYVSSPIIRNGEFVVGVYINPQKKHITKIKQLQDLSLYSVISNPEWSIDWELVNTLPFNTVHMANSFYSMIKMVDRGRVDIVLANFSTREDLILNSREVTLTPVQGVKIKLHGERVWIVSKSHPQGKEFFNSLQIGIKKLRERGTIVRAYQESGFFNRHVKSWKTLNP